MSELGETALLKLAARASGAGRLKNPDGTAKIRNPFCGDRLTVDLNVSEGRITEIGYEIRACLVCQASTSIVGAQVVGQPVADIAALGTRVEAFLKGEGNGETAEAFQVFEPMQPHLNRHVCVMMPFQGVAEAAADAETENE